jgi:hypothetical protein
VGDKVKVKGEDNTWWEVIKITIGDWIRITIWRGGNQQQQQQKREVREEQLIKET